MLPGCRSTSALLVRGAAALALAASVSLAGCADDDKCYTNGDCGAGLVCVSGVCGQPGQPRQCAAGQLACTADSECGAGRCAEGCCASACASKLDCAEGLECRNGTCRPAEAGTCAVNADCSAPTPFCKASTGACVKCLANADCGDAILVCTPQNECALGPGRCRANGDCARVAGTPVCDTAAKSCVRCLQDLDCGAGETCSAAKQCEAAPTGCSRDADCADAARPRCDTFTRGCVGCLEDTHCSLDGSRICAPATRTCEDAPRTGCSADADCAGNPNGARCRILDGACVPCLQASHCGAGQRCLSDQTCGPTNGCAGAADCSAPASVCGADRTCVECEADGQCGDGRRCAEGLCIAAQGGCASEAQCSGDAPRCRTSDRTCVACLTRDHCGPLQDCRANACVAAPCTSDAECALAGAKPRCGAQGACVDCTADAQCGAGKVCRANACVLAGCGSDAECSGATPRCRTSDRTCVECTAIDQCGAGKTCEANACVATGCGSDAECSGATPRCRTSDRTCVECTTHEQCGAGKACVNNACALTGCGSDADCASTPATPRCRTSDRTCVACTADAQCGAGKVCRSNACELAGCGSDADCASTPATPRCRTADRTCVACTADAQCGAGKVCRDSACIAAGCSTNADCASTPATPLCRTSDRACVACLSTGDCRQGYSCASGACAAATGLDAPCGTGGSCPGSLLCVGDGVSASACRATCDLYAQDSRCADGRRCAFVDFDAQGRPVGACVPGTNGGGLGAVCSATAACDVHLSCIYDTPTSGRCRRFCDPVSPSACTSPNACQKIALLDDTIPRTIGVCFPDTKYLDPCTTDGSCNAGQVCSAGPDARDPANYTNICDWPVGTKAGMAACNEDDECRSGWCLGPVPTTFSSTSGGACQQGCSTDAHCPVSNSRPGACARYPYLWKDAQGRDTIEYVPTCVPQCTGEMNCKTNDTCFLEANNTNTAWIARCKPGNSSGRSQWGGATCDSNDDCWSGVCFKRGSLTDGFCLGVCDPTRANDCDLPSECAPHGVLQRLPGLDGVSGTADDVNAKAPICWGKTCLKDGDCAGQSMDPAKPRACGASPDPRNPNDILLSCTPGIGAKKGGDFCSSDSECQTGWCIEWQKVSDPSVKTKRCFGACQSVGDCTSATTQRTCTDFRWTATTPNKLLKVCLPTF